MITLTPEQRNAIEVKTQRVYHQLCEAHGHHIAPDLRVDFTLRSRTMGQAETDSKNNLYRINYNQTLVFENFDHAMNVTIIHEVCHIVEIIVYGYHKYNDYHGFRWISLMREMGIQNPERFHHLDTSHVQRNHVRKFIYSCRCCDNIKVGTHVHNKIMKRIEAGKPVGYRCNKCHTYIQFKYEVGTTIYDINK